jgi:hypothetical protein
MLRSGPHLRCMKLKKANPAAVPFLQLLHFCIAGTLAAQWQAASKLSAGPHLRCRQLMQV